MAVTLEVSDDGIDVSIVGWFDTLMCFASTIHVDMADVIGARFVEWDEVRPAMGWRVSGAYWPGLIATGWYTMSGREGGRQFWAVFRDRSHLLAIETRLAKPMRIVIATDDRERLAWWINERVGYRG